jgi:hypothetical protein
MLDIDKLRIYAIMRNPIFNIVNYSHCVWFNVRVGRMFISLAPWLGCCCIMESKCMGPTFKVSTQSTRVPIAFKYFIMHYRLLFVIPHSPSCEFHILDIFGTKPKSFSMAYLVDMLPFDRATFLTYPFGVFMYYSMWGTSTLCVRAHKD